MDISVAAIDQYMADAVRHFVEQFKIEDVTIPPDLAQRFARKEQNVLVDLWDKCSQETAKWQGEANLWFWQYITWRHAQDMYYVDIYPPDDLLPLLPCELQGKQRLRDGLSYLDQYYLREIGLNTKYRRVYLGQAIYPHSEQQYEALQAKFLEDHEIKTEQQLVEYLRTAGNHLDYLSEAASKEFANVGTAYWLLGCIEVRSPYFFPENIDVD